MSTDFASLREAVEASFAQVGLRNSSGTWKSAALTLLDTTKPLIAAMVFLLAIGYLVETKFEASKTLIFKAFWSLKNGLDKSTITKPELLVHGRLYLDSLTR